MSKEWPSPSFYVRRGRSWTTTTEILPCLIAHVAGKITRCQIGLDGRPPHGRRQGRRFKKDLPNSAERVMHLPAGKTPRRLHDKGKDGSSLGVVEMSSELYVGAELQATRARCVKRRPNAEQADSDVLAIVVGVTWQQGLGDLDSAIRDFD